MTVSTVTADMPGIFYQTPGPGEPVFKAPGATVAKGDTLALIEVMKTFTPVLADRDGTFVQFLIDHEDSVMPGQPICEIEA